LNADVAKEYIKEINAEYYPRLDISASGGMVQQGGIFEEKYRTGVIALNAEMTLFEGNRTSSKKRQAIKNYESAQHKVEQIEREITTSTRSAYLGVLAGMSYVKAISQAVESSENALKATEAGFDVNTRSAIQVLDAQRELFKNQRDYAHARYNYILNTLRLKMAISLMTIDDVEQINGWLQ
jgi:outer membrane protein